jgi:hypothetical protein
MGTSDALSKMLDLVSPALLEDDGYRQLVDPSDCVLVAHIHILPSTVALMGQFIKLGFSPKSIVLVPKSYSTIQVALTRIQAMGCQVVPTTDVHIIGHYDTTAQAPLRRACMEAYTISDVKRAQRCILIDDGGLLTDAWWAQFGPARKPTVVSVQQTSSGLYFDRLSASVQRVNVGQSAAKRFFESKIIVAGVLREIAALHLLSDHKRLAIVGLGALGRQLGIAFCRSGSEVFTYDVDPDKNIAGCASAPNWLYCFERADLIFGCTGQNFMHGACGYLETRSPKDLLSLSSRDVEFRELLLSGKIAAPTTPFERLSIELPHAQQLVVHNGGFPINFDRRNEWETEREISLTRGLVLLGVLQALCLKEEAPSRPFEILAPAAQRRLVQLWLSQNTATCSAYDICTEDFDDTRWWYENSGGSVAQT